MIIHSLHASGFRIMGEPIDITFPIEGRIGILGQNESGKTTLFQAIECALYGLKKGSGPESDRENLVTWSKNEARLELRFTSGSNTYLLQRRISAKTGHKANLSQIIGGVPDKTNSLTSLSDIEARIEQITGMDRDSFCKLVYIKQKDLDALRDMLKAKREQLVNKVMGIELFDDASERVKQDITSFSNELENMEIQLETVRKHKDDYNSKQTQKSSLERGLAEQQLKLDAKTIELENTKKLLEKYEWISSYSSATALECSLKGQIEQAEKDFQRISQLENQAAQLTNALSTYEPEVKTLQEYEQKLLDMERRHRDEEGTQTTLQNKKQEAIKKLGLQAKELRILQNLATQKKRQLAYFGVALIGGLAFLAIAFLFIIYLLGAAIILLALSAYFFSQYLKIDKLATQNTEIEAMNLQIQEQQNRVSAIQNRRATFIAQSPYKTSEDAQNRLDTIFSQMKTDTGEGSIDGIRALLGKTQTDLSILRETNPENKKANLSSQLKENQTEIEELQKVKPVSVGEIQYSKELHESLKKQREIIQKDWTDIKESIDYDTGTIKQLNKDLNALKPDFELFPQLEKAVQLQREKIKLHTFVNTQLSETSKELRNKVLPHARLIINRILPTLTSNRYSDFDITEDLKFKVHSQEAGGYKEREIFSGGTQDQFLIALRLAFTQSILDSRVMADKYSLLMDECTSSSDEIRKQGIFEVLDAMKQTFSQIFIIAHEDIASQVDNNIVLERNEHGFTEVRSKSWTP
jgi:exonuclease SbcC